MLGTAARVINLPRQCHLRVRLITDTQDQRELYALGQIQNYAHPETGVNQGGRNVTILVT